MYHKASKSDIDGNFLRSSTGNLDKNKFKGSQFNSNISSTSKFRTEERFKWQNLNTYIVGNEELKGTLSKHEHTPHTLGWKELIDRTKDNQIKSPYSINSAHQKYKENAISIRIVNHDKNIECNLPENKEPSKKIVYKPIKTNSSVIAYSTEDITKHSQVIDETKPIQRKRKFEQSTNKDHIFDDNVSPKRKLRKSVDIRDVRQNREYAGLKCSVELKDDEDKIKSKITLNTRVPSKSRRMQDMNSNIFFGEGEKDANAPKRGVTPNSSNFEKKVKFYNDSNATRSLLQHDANIANNYQSEQIKTGKAVNRNFFSSTFKIC